MEFALFKALLSILPLLLLLLFYLLTVRSEYSNAPRSLLKPGVRVVTHGGLRGTVKQVRSTTVIVELYGGVLVEVEQQAISRVAE